MSARRLKVLFADDEPISRRLISASLRRDFELCEVHDGRAAVDAFDAFNPDAVVLDVDMPRLDGVDTARELKARAGTRFVPIFLVSGLEEQSTLIRGLEAGADDFLPKPFNAAVFRPKLEVFLRLQEMQRQLTEQNGRLAAFQRETEREHQVATQVFDRMVRRGALADPRVRVVLSSLSVFNGDAVLASQTPDGRFRMLAADVSGHGLTGALGTLPLNTLFHASTSRGDDLATCARALNDELRQVLPRQLFCAAAMIELDRARGTLDVVNAGMPPVMVVGASVRQFASRQVPLSVDRDWRPTIERVAVSPGERVFLMSDGVMEASDDQGTIFGLERVLSTLAAAPLAHAFDELLTAVGAHAGPQQSDDLSLIEVLV
ncbi:MAG: fused response regulator/phosphatase [Myxococcaceae bacterium]